MDLLWHFESIILIFKKYGVKILFFLIAEFFDVPSNFALKVSTSP